MATKTKSKSTSSNEDLVFTRRTFTGTEEEKRQAWLNARLNGIGGSEASAIVGLSQYATPLSVWMEKTLRTKREDIQSEPAYWGTKLEDVIAEEFAKRHTDEYTVLKEEALLESIVYPHMLATVDRVLVDKDGRKGILEIKTAGAHRKKDWEQGIPAYYIAQPIHYLAVTGYEFYAVAVLIGGQEYREYFYERDEDDIKSLVETEADFWQKVVNDEMPQAMGTDCDSAILSDKYTSHADEMMELLDMDVPEIEALAKLKEEQKSIDGRIKELQNKIKQRIGDHKGILTGKYQVSWIRSMSDRFDSKRFKEEHPDLADKYTEKAPRDGGLRIKEIS